MPASYNVSLKGGTIAAHFDLPTNDVATVTLGWTPEYWQRSTAMLLVRSLLGETPL